MALDSAAAPSVLEPRADPPTEPGRGIDSRWLIGFVVAFVVVVRALPLWQNGWFLDDNLYLIIAHADGFSRHWLFSNLFQHFGLLYRFAFSVQIHLMPISWHWGLAISLLLLGASVYMFDRILRLLFDSVWAPLLMAGAFGLSVLLVRSLQWWSSGLQSFPTSLGDLVCLYGYLRWIESPRNKWVALSAGGLAFALLFYEKPTFMLIYLPLIRVLFLSERISVRGIWRTAVGERRIWLTYLAVIAVWYVGVRIADAGGVFQKPTASQWIAFWRILWAQAFVPGIVGLDLPAAGLTTRQIAEAIGLQVVFLAAVAVSLIRKRVAWRAWAMILFCVLVNGFLLGEERIVPLAPTIGWDPRYQLDFTWLVPLLLCFAFSRRRSFWPRAERLLVRVRSPFTGARPAWQVVLTAAAAVAYVVATQLGTAQQQRTWPGHDSYVWEHNIGAGIAAFTRGSVRPVVADGETPYEMMADIYPPYNHLSYVLPFFEPQVHVDGPLDGPLVGVNPLGGVQPALIDPLQKFTFPDRCIAGGKAGVTMWRNVQVHPPVSAAPYYLILDYGAGTTARYMNDLGQTPNEPPADDIPVGLNPSIGRSIAFLGPDVPKQIVVNIPPRAQVCLTGIEFASLRLQ